MEDGLTVDPKAVVNGAAFSATPLVAGPDEAEWVTDVFITACNLWFQSLPGSIGTPTGREAEVKLAGPRGRLCGCVVPIRPRVR